MRRNIKMKDEYRKKDKYRKLSNYLQKRFDKISNGKVNRFKFYQLVFLDMILDKIEGNK